MASVAGELGGLLLQTAGWLGRLLANGQLHGRTPGRTAILVERRTAAPGVDLRKDPLQSEWSFALHDDLTGLRNRRVLNELLRDYWSDVVAFHGEVMLMVVALDCLTEIGDTYGELIGDKVLSTAATLLKQHLRDDDVVIRYGETEFVLVLPGAGQADEPTLRRRVHTALVAHPFFAKGEGPGVATSLAFRLGVASSPTDGGTGEQLLELAQSRLQVGDPKPEPSVDPASQVPAPRLRRYPRGGIAAAAALVMVAAVYAVSNWGGSADHESPPGSPLPAATQATPPPSTAPPRRDDQARLEAYVRDLENKIESMARDASSSQHSDRDDTYEATIRELQEKIQQLQEESAPGQPAVTGPSDEATAPAAATVRASQDQPLMSRDTSEPDASETTAERATSEEPPSPATLTRPILTRWSQPAYPVLALRLRKEGVVRVRVLVDEEGQVIQAEALKPAAGFGFDDAAREAALEAIYRPGTRNGEPVQMETIIAVRFALGR